MKQQIIVVEKHDVMIKTKTGVTQKDLFVLAIFVIINEA